MLMDNLDIASNIKAVELMKVELLQKVTDLYSHIYAEPDSESGERLAKDCAEICAITLGLGKRLGVGYDETLARLSDILEDEGKVEDFSEKL